MIEKMDGLPFEEYMAIDAVSSTLLRAFKLSPRNYKRYRALPFSDSDAFRVGRASHTAILEPHRLEIDYVVWDGGRRYGKKWDEILAENAGKTVLTRTQHDTAMRIGEAVSKHPIAKDVLADPGEIEVTLTWKDQGTGLFCKGRPDRLGSYVLDVKTTRDPSPKHMALSSVRYGYDIQAAMYCHAAELLTGSRPRSKIIAAQNTEPYDVAVYELSQGFLSRGQYYFRDLLTHLSMCIAADHWPGAYEDREMLLDIPEWAIDYPLDLIFEGEKLEF